MGITSDGHPDAASGVSEGTRMSEAEPVEAEVYPIDVAGSSGEDSEVVEATEIITPETFEGSDVVDWEVRFPSAVVETDRSFKRGSVIRLAVDVRVKNVSYVENRDGNLVRVHHVVMDDIEVVSTFAPGESRENVGGSLAGGGQQFQVPELEGLKTGTTQDTWPPKTPDDAA